LVITLVLAIIRAAVTLVASFFVIVVMTTLGAIGASSLLGFLGIGIAICYLY
jgi:hypothetical protein